MFTFGTFLGKGDKTTFISSRVQVYSFSSDIYSFYRFKPRTFLKLLLFYEFDKKEKKERGMFYSPQLRSDIDFKKRP